MRFEGTLDAFALPELLHLLDHTRKSGVLHVRGATRRGFCRFAEGRLVAAGAGAPLVRRLVGAGAVGDEELAAAVELCAGDPSGVVLALRDLGSPDPAVLARLAWEHTVDAVFDLSRERDGEFALTAPVAEQLEVELSIEVEDVVAELARRAGDLDGLRRHVPSLDVVVGLAPPPEGETVVRRDEWAMLALLDGRRTVADIVALTGRGEYAVTCALAGLVERALVVVGSAGAAAGAADLVRRQALLDRLDGAPAPAPPVEPPAEPAGPAGAAPALPGPRPPADPWTDPGLLRRVAEGVRTL